MTKQIIALLLLANYSFAQTADSSLIDKLKNTRENVKDIRLFMHDAGFEFKMYYKYQSVGTILGIGGAAVTIVGASSPTIDNKGKSHVSPFVYAGAGVSLIGWIVAPVYIKNAGIIFDNAGISIPLNKNKKAKA